MYTQEDMKEYIHNILNKCVLKNLKYEGENYLSVICRGDFSEKHDRDNSNYSIKDKAIYYINNDRCEIKEYLEIFDGYVLNDFYFYYIKNHFSNMPSEQIYKNLRFMNDYSKNVLKNMLFEKRIQMEK